MIRLASAAMLSLALLFAFALPAAASQDITPPYLALGDSVAFGYRGGLPPQDYADPNAFVGYPQLLAQMLGLNLTNAACPGQTSGSFISTSAPDNGCNAYRAAFPLHTQYTGTQLAFAIAFLRAHPNTQLVTLGLGANDLFLLQDACAGSTQCVEQGLPGLLRSLSHNLDTIDNGLRTAAGYHGRLVGVTYYATDYRNAAEVEAVGALDLAIATETLAHGGRVADGFVAFAIASRSSGGDVCAAGLLNRLPTGVCDVHPSLKGHAVLARAVEAALR